MVNANEPLATLPEARESGPEGRVRRAREASGRPETRSEATCRRHLPRRGNHRRSGRAISGCPGEHEADAMYVVASRRTVHVRQRPVLYRSRRSPEHRCLRRPSFEPRVPKRQDEPARCARRGPKANHRRRGTRRTDSCAHEHFATRRPTKVCAVCVRQRGVESLPEREKRAWVGALGETGTSGNDLTCQSTCHLKAPPFMTCTGNACATLPTCIASGARFRDPAILAIKGPLAPKAT